MKRRKQPITQSTTKGDIMKEEMEKGRPETGTEVETQSPPPDAPQAPEVLIAPEPTNNKDEVEAATEEAAFEGATRQLSALNTDEHPPDAPQAPEVPVAPEPTPKKYAIDFDLYHANGATEFKQIEVEAATEEAAFEGAARQLSALNTDEHPITWRYRGSFKAM